MKPKIVLVCTNRWFTSARLAIALVKAGCTVEVVCPRSHPVAKTRETSKIYPYETFAPLRSVRAAIEAAQPDFLIPCDDVATAHLHRLYDEASSSVESVAATRTLIERSLGERSSFAVAEARTRLMTFAHEQGIRVPVTAVIRTRDELTAWLARNSLPAVLKVDGTAGGGGVRIVHSLSEATRAWQTLDSPPTAMRAIKHVVMNRDLSQVVPWLRRARPVINVQSFISGQNANGTVAAWKGKVLAEVTVNVVHTMYTHGPASVVQMAHNSEISTAIAKIVCQLKLSGLYGFDFVIEEKTGEPYLIEMNPRATQICHLQLGPGRDLPAALHATLSGEPLRESPSVTDKGLIAFFPQEWLRDPISQFLHTAYHDVPWDQPDLIRACIEEDRRFEMWAAILSRRRLAAKSSRN